MGIYGESMCLVTEGKLIDKFKKTLNHLKTKYKNWSEKYSVDNFNDMELFFLDIEFHGHLEYYKKYFKGNLNTIFSKIDSDTAEDYLKQIERIFHTNDTNKISNTFESYIKKRNFEYTEQDDKNIVDDTALVMGIHAQSVQMNIDRYEKIDKENVSKEYKSAILIQSFLFGVFKILAEFYFNERNENMKHYF